MSNVSSPTEMQRQLQASIDASQKWQRGFFMLSALWLLVVVGASWAFWTSTREFARTAESIENLERNAKKHAEAIEGSKRKADDLETALDSKQGEVLLKIQRIEENIVTFQKQVDVSVLARLTKLDTLAARAWVSYSRDNKPRAVNASVQPKKGPNGPYYTVTFDQRFDDNEYAAVGSSTIGYVSFSVNTPESVDVYIHSLVKGSWTQIGGDFSVVVFAKVVFAK